MTKKVLAEAVSLLGGFLRDDQASYKSGHGGNSAWLGILYSLRG